MKGEIPHNHLLATKASVSSMSRGVGLTRTHSLRPSSKRGVDSPIPSLNPEPTYPENGPEEPLSFSSGESEPPSESCYEFDPQSPDSIFDESNIFGSPERGRSNKQKPSPSRDPAGKLMRIPIRNLLRVKKGVSWDLTLGDIVQEALLHLQPGLALTIKQILAENASRCEGMSSTGTNSSRATVSSTASDRFLSGNSHAPSFVQLNYGVDEEMNAMKKILDNPWNPDETFDLSRLQIETMDSWKKDFIRLNKVLEDKKEPQSVDDSWDTATVDVTSNQSSGTVVSSTISTSNLNQTSQVQQNCPVQTQPKFISTQMKQKLFRIYIFSILFIFIIGTTTVLASVVFELSFYGGHSAHEREDEIWLRHRQRSQFFLSSNIA